MCKKGRICLPLLLGTLALLAALTAAERMRNRNNDREPREDSVE